MTNLKFEDSGMPIQDGYVTIYLRAPFSEERYPFVGYDAEPHNFGMTIIDDDRTFQKLIPWDKINCVVQTYNSQEFRDALGLFQLQCEHNWVQQEYGFNYRTVCMTCTVDKRSTETVEE